MPEPQLSPPPAPRAPASRAYARYAVATLVWLLVVVLWGAFVRASGSGAGCGAHWPLCNGVVVPRAPAAATIVEFSHRLTSGLLAIAVAGLAVGAWRVYPAGHRVRRAALASLGFVVLEALIGAGLVLFEMVAENASVARAWWMAAHLVNTFLFIGAVLLTAWWAGGAPRLRLRGREGVAALFASGVLAMLVLGVSGAIAALGDTLFPSASLAEGMRQDFAPAAHVFVRLRIAHPILAIATAGWLAVLIGLTLGSCAGPRVRRRGAQLGAVLLAQVAAGFVNLALLAPIWMQLVHLLLADLVWIALLLLGFEALAEDEEEAVEPDAPSRATKPAVHA